MITSCNAETDGLSHNITHLTHLPEFKNFTTKQFVNILHNIFSIDTIHNDKLCSLIYTTLGYNL